MLKEYITNALTRLKKAQVMEDALGNLGINMCDYTAETALVGTIEESIAIMLSTGDEQKFEQILDDVQWWLYESVEKIIHYDDKPIVDVTKVEDFVNWLFEHYYEPLI